MYLLVIRQLAIMLAIAVSGFAVTRAFKFGKTEQQYVSKTLLYFINPCLILGNFNRDFNAGELRDFADVLLYAFLIHFIMIAIALVFVRSRTEEGKELDCIDRIAVVFTNCGFIGIPLIQGVFPGQPMAVFYLIAFLTAFNIFLWTFGYFIVCGKINFKKIITNPNIIALVAGMLIFIAPFKLPSVLANGKSGVIDFIASMNTATSMILLGMLFANYTRPGVEKIFGRVVRLCLLRYVVTGLVMFGLTLLVLKNITSVADIRMKCYVAYIAALCPVGMSVSSFAVVFHKDESYSALLVLVTSALCVVTLPVSVFLLEQFL
ncbi:AEC family transporter [Treponema sp.]|uniref:AEC family transporter n=1 Tax=Treponema sp. TaxID=166 RepID=UPI0025FB83AB|nr:AEC family transporter [Treponema sp.]MCR5218383.1 AEC family transporter [Treponema sp.]